MHQVEGVINFIKAHGMRDKRFPDRYHLSSHLQAIPGNWERPFTPPNAEPFHTRPVTNWNGRVEISDQNLPPPMITGLTPAAVRTFQRRSHHVDVTDAFKGMVDTPFVDISRTSLIGLS